jgi:hypothetical protein
MVELTKVRDFLSATFQCGDFSGIRSFSFVHFFFGLNGNRANKSIYLETN